MREADKQAYERHFPSWADEIVEEIKSVGMCSPDLFQTHQAMSLFPGATVEELTISEWDLSQPAPQNYDLVCAMNVMMCSPNPTLWFGNMCKTAKYVWIQDNILGCRNHPNEIDPSTKDVMRYSYKEHRARLPEAFDLEAIKDRILKFETYAPNSCHEGCPNKAFLVMLKGDR